MITTKADVEAATSRHRTEASCMQSADDDGLLALREAWTRESRDSELLQSILRWLGGIIGSLSALGEVGNQDAHDLVRGDEEIVALFQKDALRSKPRELVQDSDQVLVIANEASLSVWGL